MAPDGEVVDNDPADWILPSEAARILGVSQFVVKGMANRGELPFILTLGGWRRYSKKAALALREQRGG